MNITVIKELVAAANEADQCSSEYDEIIKKLNLEIKPLLGQLEQLICKGPVDDGDITSKSKRDDLISIGLANKVCVKGQQGFTAATYFGWDVFNANAH